MNKSKRLSKLLGLMIEDIKMSMGLGKTYWVEIIKYTSGTLDHCLKFMTENKPTNKFQWYELRPIPDLKNNTCDDYMCSLVKADQKPK